MLYGIANVDFKGVDTTSASVSSGKVTLSTPV